MLIEMWANIKSPQCKSHFCLEFLYKSHNQFSSIRILNLIRFSSGMFLGQPLRTAAIHVFAMLASLQ